MAHILVVVNGNTMFDGEVTDWTVPPTPPTMQGSIRAADLPPTIRDILAKAMCAAIEKATGFKYKRVT